MTVFALPPRIRLPGLLLATLILALPLAAKPVAFAFRVSDNGADPWARDIWAEVRLPNGHTQILPAFVRGPGEFAVHARAEFPGVYRLGRVTERSGGSAGHSANGEIVGLKPELASPETVDVARVTALSPVSRQGHRFFTRAGHRFVPIGANVPWPQRGMAAEAYYRDAFARFGAERLNWMRIWMAHWGHLNLDWLPAEADPASGSAVANTPRRDSVPPGHIDAQVAATWDQLIELAERHGVYVQLVLQHHGQYSTTVNSNWQENPWNLANPGGFLRTPRDFFTSERARELTKRKYRYIVARWGYSPAILAWELFNEVHWVDAINQQRDVAAVAAWHDEMADALRSFDRYQHLVTTSTEDLGSPIYAKMDYYQPHLYPSDAITGARQVNLTDADRPVFYGEQGDDHLAIPGALKQRGDAIVPPVWGGLFGATRMPAQAWLGHDILSQRRDAELGAVARFIAETRLYLQGELEVFSPVVERGDRWPFTIAGCQVWQRRAEREFVIPLDGSRPVELAEIPRMLSARGADVGFPSRMTFRVDLPRPVRATLTVPAIGSGPTGVAISVGGATVAEARWKPGERNTPSRAHPQQLRFDLAAGRQVIEVRNTGRAAWVEVSGLELGGIDAPVLGAAGLRREGLVAVWVWNQRDVYQPAPQPVSGTVVIDDLPAGEWRVTWWDTVTGRAQPATHVRHRGGHLRVDTPGVHRHAAVVLTRR